MPASRGFSIVVECLLLHNSNPNISNNVSILEEYVVFTWSYVWCMHHCVPCIVQIEHNYNTVCVHVHIMCVHVVCNCDCGIGHNQVKHIHELVLYTW